MKSLPQSLHKKSSNRAGLRINQLREVGSDGCMHDVVVLWG